MQFADVNLDSFQILIPSLDANLNVSLTLTVREASFARVRDVLRNQIHVILLHVDQEQFVL